QEVISQAEADAVLSPADEGSYIKRDKRRLPNELKQVSAIQAALTTALFILLAFLHVSRIGAPAPAVLVAAETEPGAPAGFLRVLTAILLSGPPARASRYVTYIVRPTDTPESIAAEFYGNRARAQFIIEFNGLARGARLRAGQAVKIPTSYRYRLNPGETLPDL